MILTSSTENFLASGPGMVLALLTSILTFREGYTAKEGITKVIWQTFAILMLCILIGAGIYFGFWIGTILGASGLFVEGFCVMHQLKDHGRQTRG